MKYILVLQGSPTIMQGVHVTSNRDRIYSPAPAALREIPSHLSKMQPVFYQFAENGDVEAMICNTRDHFEGEEFPVTRFSLDRLNAEDISDVLVFPVYYNARDCIPPPPN